MTRLDHAGEVAALDDLLDQPQLLVGEARIVVPDGDGRGDVGLADDVGAELLERGVGIHRLVVGVGVEKRRGLVGHHLLEDRGDRFALGEPLPADLRQQLRRVGLVEHDRAGRPAIGEGQPVELVEEAGGRGGRKPDDGQHPQMRVAQHRLEAAGQRLVGQHRVEMHRDFGDADALAFGRDGRVQIGQRLRVVEPGALGHEAFDELEHAIGAVDEAAQRFAGVGALGALAAFIEEALGAGGVFGRRQVEEGQEIARLEVNAFLLEFGLALGVDQGRCGVRKPALGIVEGRMRCASTKTAQPEPSRRSALLSRPATPTSSAGTALSRSGPRNRAVRWKLPSLLRTTPFSTSAAQGRKSARRVIGRRYSARFIMRPASDAEMAGDAQMAAHHVDEHRIALGRPDGGGMADHPEHEPGDPKAKAQAQRGGQRAVQDRDRPRRAAEQDRLGQRPMDRRDEAGRVRRQPAVHQISAPPPKEKNDRKKLDGGEGDREAEDDLDQPAKSARGVAERQRQAGDDDDDHRDDLGDRAFDRLQDLIERLLPRHVGAGGPGGGTGERGDADGGNRCEMATDGEGGWERVDGSFGFSCC